MLAILVRGHSHNLDFISRFQRRGCTEGDTAGRKRELQGIVEIVIPSHYLLFRAIRIHNDLHVDALFTCFIFVTTSHMYPPAADKNRILNNALEPLLVSPISIARAGLKG